MRKVLQKITSVTLIYLAVVGQLYANGITSAYISDQTSNQLTIVFSSAVQTTNSEGFRLLGGAARIKSLVAGNGSNKLTFSLTDHVLPDDQFTVTYWPELGNATMASEQLNAADNVPVSNQAKIYHGEGELFYVSTSGSDQNDGRSASRPLLTIDNAQRIANPGDYVLLRRGDTFKTPIVVQKSGRVKEYITFAAYGRGNKPIIDHSSKDTFVIDGKDYVAVDNLHFKVRGSGEAGVHFMGNSLYPTVSNCRIEGIGKPHYGVNYGKNDGSGKVVVYPQVLNNYITGFRWNIRSSGYPYDGTHEVKGGLIENNVSKDNYQGGNDGISAQRGNYHGLVIRKNEVSGWYDDGMDFFAAHNVIVEHNTLHSPQQPAVSGQGIKAGGRTGSSDKIGGHQSDNIIVRYNKVYNLYNRATDKVSHNGIQTNGGKTGQIYGNVVYDVQGTGIVVSGGIGHWQVHHNTVVNAGKDGLQLYTDGSTGGNVEIQNNILGGKNNDLRCIIKGGDQAKGERNLLLQGKSAGKYTGNEDFRAKEAELFINSSAKNFRLKDQAQAIDAGVNISQYTKTRQGVSPHNKPDVGAYEYIGFAPSPTPAPSPSPSPAPAPTPAPSPAPPKTELLASVQVNNPVKGLMYDYYEGQYQQLPDFAALQPVKSGKTATIDLSPRDKDENIAFVFTGYYKAPKDGMYTFYTTSDDGSRLFIGEQRVVDNDGLHTARERSGTVGLEAGYHPITVTFFEQSGAEVLKVEVATPNKGKRNLSSDELFLEDKKQSKPAPPSSDNGLNYRYYEGEWRELPDFSKIEKTKEGQVSGFDLSVRQRNDHFGIVYYGNIQIDRAGEYTFFTKSDDGSTLYIDGVLVVDNDGLHGPRERSGKLKLGAGRHKIEVRFFERTIGEVLEVSYAGANVSKRLIPTEKLYPDSKGPLPSEPTAPAPDPVTPVVAKAGLHYKYYEGRWGALPNFNSLKVIKEGVSPNFSLLPAAKDRYFGFVYTGYIKVDQAGDYTFYTVSDDGSKLYINGKQIVDNDRIHAARERSGKVNLEVGYHKIEVRYFENAYGEELWVGYQGPGVSKQRIPNKVLFLNKPTNDAAFTLARATDFEGSGTENSGVSGTVAPVVIYPNPAQGMVNVRLENMSGSATIKLKHITEHVLYERTVSGTSLTQTIKIDLSVLRVKSGTYIISAEGSSLGTHTLLLIVE